MVINNSQMFSFNLLTEATVPSSNEQAAVTAQTADALALRGANNADLTKLEDHVKEWAAAKLKHRLQKALSRRINRSIAARAIALNGAEICLRVAKDFLASGLEQNIGVIKKFIKDARAKR
jgi:hypothetical protein